MSTDKKQPPIPMTIWVIGVVALLVNLSSIMIYSLSPLYLTHVFGLSLLSLGLLEGFIEFTAWSTRIFAGMISDYFQKRKPLLILAYALTLLTRPLFAFAPSLGWIYAAKIIDRFSNGIQATPREALVADAAPHEIKGACYGLRQSLSVIGSVIGAILVMILMRQTDNDYPFIFLAASLPLLLALFVLIIFIKETPQKASSDDTSSKKFSFYTIFRLKKNFWRLILVSGIFMLSNYGSTYRILRAESLGFLASDIAIVMIIQNLGIMLASFPIGKLSDRYDRRIYLGIGFIITILSNLVWGIQGGQLEVSIATALWGVQMGITQSVMATMVADNAEKELRGTAFGIYYFVMGTALFLANSSTGFLMETYGITEALTLSSFFAIAGILLLPIICITPTSDFHQDISLPHHEEKRRLQSPH